ncbi:retropepsin-like aspartic protease [Chengkuizengella axinellae]|uniref:Retropepsin-like aspartic protease n=1 Tax=Chengkuizengella axinellae TaxID=3064388 RepID=A0ABT9ITZ0_9BACL|nr:retropepsin-like aspartic protease [Chengkuizengella sp. 2205SS18-9]MDP5272815.1 retropepsin-like aspartic protease [Chengkuizengella sp. 2205SS18-9]
MRDIIPIKMENGLPFIKLELINNNKKIVLNHVLIDTGSASTIFKLDSVKAIGLGAEQDDVIGKMLGVGGSEYVIYKTVDTIIIGNYTVHNYQINIGSMNYGINIDGMLGIDLLQEIKGIIHLDKLFIEVN